MTRPNGTNPEDTTELDDGLFGPDDDNEPQDDSDLGVPSPPNDDDDSLPTDGTVTDDQNVRNLQAQVKDLNSRIGKLAKANDDRLKEQEKEWKAWGDNYRNWAQAEIEKAFAQGKEAAEERFLPFLSPEEKAKYFEESRETSKAAQRAAQATAQARAQERAQVSAAINDAVMDAVSRGVPREALDTRSPQAVLNSAMDWLTENRPAKKGRKPAPVDDDDDEDEEVTVESLQKQVNDLQSQLRRERRDSSGASRTPTGTGGAAQSQKSKRIAELETEIARAKRLRRPTEVIVLKRELQALQAS